MSGFIPQAFIEQLNNQNDLVALINDYVPLKQSGTSYVACCPFHNEKSASFNVIPKKQFFYCFGCGAHGTALSFIMRYLNLEFVEAIEFLAAKSGLDVPREQNNYTQNHPDNLHSKLSKKAQKEQRKTQSRFLNEISQAYQHNLKYNGEIAINYLKKRGISGHIAKRYQLGYAKDDWQFLENLFPQQQQLLLETGMLVSNEQGKIYDRFRQRVMFPIHNACGELIAFGGRALEAEQKPKYLNSPETELFKKNQELYGLYQLLAQQQIEQQKNKEHANVSIRSSQHIDFIVIVEGYMDVIALAQHGIHQVVATLGTATNTNHIQLLKGYTNRLYFCFDGDEAGRKAAWRALESSLPLLNSGLDVNFIFLPDGQDPDSLIRQEGKEALSARLTKSLPFNQFLFTSLEKNLNLERMSDKIQLINASKTLLQLIPEGPCKEFLIAELAQRCQLEHERITDLLALNRQAIRKSEGYKQDPTTMRTSQLPESDSIERSPLNRTLALILQEPELSTKIIQDLHLSAQDFLEEEQFILRELLQQKQRFPEKNSQELIALWQDSKFFNLLTKLLTWSHQIPAALHEQEFMGLLLTLKKQKIDAKIQQFLQKSKQDGLKPEEIKELTTLINTRHQLKGAGAEV